MSTELDGEITYAATLSGKIALDDIALDGEINYALTLGTASLITLAAPRYLLDDDGNNLIDDDTNRMTE